jgi:hypothetical protein
MQNGLWASAVLALYPKPLSRRCLSLPVLLMLAIVIASLLSRTAILTQETFTLIDAGSAAVTFTAFVLWIMQWSLKRRFVAAFLIHGCSHWIWRSLWFPPLVGTQIAILLAFPIWRLVLLWAWIRLLSSMVEGAETAFEKAVTSIQQLKLTSPLSPLHVMISSTLEDLERERDAAEGAILALDLYCFRAEKLPGVSVSPREFCELMAKQCDIFILIIGDRYGYVIESDGISVVESEYEVARRENAGKILVYKKDHVQREDERLRKFLERVKNYDNGYPMSSFTTPEELSVQIPRGIVRWLIFRMEQSKANQG